MRVWGRRQARGQRRRAAACACRGMQPPRPGGRAHLSTCKFSACDTGRWVAVATRASMSATVASRPLARNVPELRQRGACVCVAACVRVFVAAAVAVWRPPQLRRTPRPCRQLQRRVAHTSRSTVLHRSTPAPGPNLVQHAAAVVGHHHAALQAGLRRRHQMVALGVGEEAMQHQRARPPADHLHPAPAAQAR